MQPQQRGTWTQPFHCDLSAETELRNTIELRTAATQIAAPKAGSRRPSGKTTILKHFLKGFLKVNIISAKMKKLLPKHHSQLSCCHYILLTIYDSQLQKHIVLRTQPQQEGTLTQPFHCHLQRLSCKT